MQGTQYRYAIGALAILVSASPAQAAGFYIQESSVSSLGVAFANSASGISDASTIWFNPAGMTDLNGRQLNLGVNLLLPTSKLTDTGSTFNGAPVGGGDGGNPYDPTPVPNLFFAAPLQDGRAWAGIGINAPFGLANEYDAGYFGRFDSTETELTVINVSPVMAYKINDRFSFGGGLDFQYANADLKSNVSNIASTGVSELKGKDYSIGYNFGATYKPMDGTKIGATYRSAIEHTLDGTISVRGLTAGNFSIAGSADLNLPDIATLGITQDIDDDWRVMAQASYYGWEHFDSITARNAAGTVVSQTLQSYENTMAYSLGTEYDVDDTLTLRAGYQFDPTPTGNLRSSRTPDGDRHWFTTGASYQWSDAATLDFGAAYIDVGNETINVTRNSGLASVRANSEGHVGIVSAALSYKF